MHNVIIRTRDERQTFVRLDAVSSLGRTTPDRLHENYALAVLCTRYYLGQFSLLLFVFCFAVAAAVYAKKSAVGILYLVDFFKKNNKRSTRNS